MGSAASKKRRETSQPVTRVSLIGSASPASPSGPVAAAPNGATAKTVRTFTEEYVRYLVEVEKREVVIIHGKVYDVTEFTPSHPGGASAIRRAADTEAGELFDSIHGESARPMLAPYFIGDLAPPGDAELSAAEVQRRIMEDGRALLVLHGNVYDVTDFVASHPGGRASIMARLGEEAGDLFDRIHGRRAKASAAAYRIGRLLKEQGTGEQGTGEQGGEQWFVGTVLRVEAAAADVRYVTVSSPARLALLPGGHIDIDIGTPNDIDIPSPDPNPCPCPCPIPCPILIPSSASASSGGSSGWTRPFTPFLCEAECFTLAVRCYPGGAASAVLHALLPGALLRYRGPRAPPWRACADVRLQRTAAADRRVLLVCGGTGVAPMYTIAADLLETRAAAVTVAACFRCPDALLLRRELAALAARHGGDGAFRLHYVFSRMAKEMVEPMAKEMTEACAVHSGRFGEGVARALGRATVAVLCGPPGFAEDVAEELVAAGVCAEDALREL